MGAIPSDCFPLGVSLAGLETPPRSEAKLAGRRFLSQLSASDVVAHWSEGSSAECAP
jgi:hypothetical protein